ncbi:MAG TPA: hypothetical protein VFG87_14125 [Amycolatopsis sp.]|nr:hypothetical protein [Amycolatopsis sp.]
MGRHNMVEDPAPPPPPDRPTSTGQRRALGREAATATVQFRAVDTESGPTTGQQRAIGREPNTTTGQHRVIGREAGTATGQYRVAGREPGTATGQHRIVGREPSGATGQHRVVGAAVGRRRIATWPIVSGALAVFLVVGLLGWGWANNVLNSRAEAQANGCSEGSSTMRVVVAPGIAAPITSAAAKWNQANTVVHSHCVHIDVQAVDSTQVFDALTAPGATPGAQPDSAAIGGVPAAWIPESGPQATDWAGKLGTARPDLAPTAQPLATGYSYIELGSAVVDDVSARAAQVFRDFLLEPAQQADFSSAGLAQAAA